MIMNHTNLNNEIEHESAIIVGASLSGLMTGIALAREGLYVTILEKVGEEQRTGSGLQVDGGTFEMSKTGRLLRKLASGGKSSVQLWSSIESRLRTEALQDGKIAIQYNTKVEEVNQDENAAWVVTEHGETLRASMVIGADGHRSLVREHIAPHKPHATYAGYIVWIVDPIDELELPEERRPSPHDLGVNMMHGPNGFMFGNVLVTDDGSSSGKRSIGCAWYDNSRTDLLYRLGCVKNNIVHHSLKGPDIPEDTLNELAELTKGYWREPWLSATLHALENRTLTGIPIKEYVPERLVKGRVAIIGDAAHVPAPITASGFNESLEDAIALGKCVAKEMSGNDAIDALEKYENQRLNKVRQMVLSGQSYSRSFGRP